MARWAGVAATALVALLLLGTGAVAVLTRTDPGREIVRRYTIRKVAPHVNGKLDVGRLDGNFITGATLHDITILDPDSIPVLRVKTLSFKFRFRDMIAGRILLDDVRIVRPIVRLDKPPGGEWNYRRVIRERQQRDTTRGPGFGSWIAATDVTIEDGDLEVRSPWAPDESLSPARRDSAARAAVAGATRLDVVAAKGGYQKVMRFEDIDGTVNRIRLADPDSPHVFVDARRLDLIAWPFRPPAAEVRSLAGTLTIMGDSLVFDDLRIAFPDSRVMGHGVYTPDGSDARGTLRGDPFAFADFRWISPSLPERGGGRTDLVVSWIDRVFAFDASAMRVVIDGATVRGSASAVFQDPLLVRDSDLRFSGVSTALLHEFIPDLEIPWAGTFAGRVAAAGRPDALDVDTELYFDASAAGSSHVTAVGTLGFGDAIAMRALRTRLDPLQVELARTFLPDLPIGGTLTGDVTLDGSTATAVRANLDVAHRDSGEFSRLAGTASFTAPRGFELSLQVLPLSMETVGRFAPSARLRGEALGTVAAHGSFDDLGFEVDLVFPGAGALIAEGSFDLRGAEPVYHIAARPDLIDANRISGLLPHAALAGTIVAAGTGFDPATMQATLAADLHGVEVDSLRVDTAIVRATTAAGLAQVDTLLLRSPAALASAAGTFGLVEGRSGELRYRVDVDSLGAFSRWLPPADSGVVRPRPARVAASVEKARADSALFMRRTEVQRAALGYPLEPELNVDSIRAIPRDSVDGRVASEGLLRGNVKHFEAEGQVALADIILRGNAIQAGSARFGVTNAPAEGVVLEADAKLVSVELQGFGYDSVAAEVDYAWATRNGEARLRVHQDDRRDYTLEAKLRLEPEHKEMRFEQLVLRFDTTQWVSAQPASFAWVDGDLRVTGFELQSSDSSVIRMEGTLPAEGEGALVASVRGFEIAHAAALLQASPGPAGQLALETEVQGSQRSPRLGGGLMVAYAMLDSTRVPDATAVFQYEDRRLAAEGHLFERGDTVVSVQARLPIDLALRGHSGPRLLDDSLAIDVRADSLPLEGLGELTEAIDSVTGLAAAMLEVRGTFDDLRIEGMARLDHGTVRIVPAGVTLDSIAGAFSFREDSAVVDSLSAMADGGPIRLSGGVDVSDARKPVFDLKLDADGARVLNNEHGRIRANADLEITGPLGDTHIGGKATIAGGVIYLANGAREQRIDLRDPATAAVDDTVHRDGELILPRSPLTENLVIDIELAIDRDTWVRNADANVEVHTPPDVPALHVQLNEATGRLHLEGFLNTDRGGYSFMGRRFELKTGSATFIPNGKLNPLLQITAEHEVAIPSREAIVIQIVVTGTLGEPKVALSSDAQPPLSESDLISYLAFGTSSSSLLLQKGSGLSGASSTSGDLVGNVAALATRQLTTVALDVLVNDFERDAGRSLGLDVFQITPADVPDALTFSSFGSVFRGTELNAGKYLSPRLFVGGQLRATGAPPGVLFEYRTPRGFRWLTSFEARYLPREPTLEREPLAFTTGVFGAFLFKVWRW